MTMKTDDEEVIERVLELDAKAKEGPWAYENCGEKCNDIFIGTMCRIDGRGDPLPPESGCPETTDEDGNEIDFYREAVAHIDDSSTQGFPVQDAALIAEYRTAAPDLARRLRERNARIAVLEKQLGEADEALTWIEENTDWYEAFGAGHFNAIVLAAAARTRKGDHRG